METTEAFVGLTCSDCGERVDPEGTPGRCPDCGGILDATYDYDRIDPVAITGERDGPRGAGDSLWRYEPLLPFPRSAAVSLGEGGTPIVECPDLAAEFGVDGVLIKDEGRAPTGSVEDRGLAVAVTAALQDGVSDVALPSTGDSGQAAAAYAARAGLDAHAFVPSRAGFSRKAMINVHGGDMTVVEGRFEDAVEAYEGALDDEGWHGLRAFHTPYRREGAKTWFYEVVADLGWTAPDAVVVPTGDGVALVGAHQAAIDLLELGIVDERPRIYAAQPAGCSPVADAVEAGADRVPPREHPDTICGSLEVADPAGGERVLTAIEESDGGAVAVEDEALLEASCAIAAIEGLEIDPAAGVAVRGTETLVEEGEIGADETAVLLCPAAGQGDADVLRSHLMRKGI